ncbi:MAG: purine-binding chemotaxis protein CheW [Colwellia sp.]|nr:purine-binding chemotaxis protein CheW [Colwellia sp.]
MSETNVELIDKTSVEESEELEESIVQYLTFCLQMHVVGVRLKSVKEVMGVKSITTLPRTPKFVRGVINLRGQIVPVIDLKLKFGMGITDFTVDSCIIIVEVQINDEAMIIGALADSVKDVIELQEENIDPAPKMGAAIDSKFIVGMSMQENDFFTILNTQVLFSIDELMEGADSGTVSASVT